MEKINKFSKIGISIVFLFVVLAYSNSAAGEFNVPLNWVLGPTGISVDNDNDGIIDAGFVSGSGPWNSSGTNIFLNDTTARVGIGTATPAHILHVIGNINITGSFNATRIEANEILVNGAVVNRSIDLTPYAPLDSPTFTTSFTATGLVDIGDIGTDAVSDDELDGGFSWTLDADLNIDSNTLVIDQSANLVGIGTAGPYTELTVIGSVGVSGSINASSINTTGSAYFATASGNVGIGTITPLQTLVVIGTVNITDSLNITNNIEIGGFFIGDGSLLTGIVTGSTGPFNSSGTNVYLNDSNSKVGIGTTNPTETLSVIGNFSTTQTNNTLGNFTILQFNSTCVGFRFNGTTGGGIFSCAP